MVWLKVKANIALERKFLEAGPIASWLWLAGLGFCRVHETDGFIAKVHVPALSPGLSQPFKHAAKLVEVTLWEDTLGGYLVHDYLDWNPSKEQLSAFRAGDSSRKKKDGKSATSKRIPEGSLPDSKDVPFTRARAGAKSPSPSESASEGVVEESPRETTPELVDSTDSVPPAWRKAGAPTPQAQGLAAGAARHGLHAWCCDRGLCVPLGLHSQFRGRLQGDEADRDARLKAFYARTIAAVNGIEVGDTVFRFWENAFAHWIAPVTAAPVHRTTTTRGARNGQAWDDAAAALETRRDG